MEELAVQAQRHTADQAVKDLLVAGMPAGRRLATAILRDALLAEDAAQEAALLAWDRRRGLRDPDAVEAWFSRIVVNVCRQYLRRAARKPIVADISTGDLDGQDRFAQRDELGRAIRRLPPDEQVLLGLRYGRDLTVPMIAAVVGKREGTVKSGLHSAHEHLRAMLDADRRLEESSR